MIGNLLTLAIYLAIAVACLAAWWREGRDRRKQQDALRRGVEVEAEILSRFEAGAVQGSELAKARQSLMTSWDPLELELRYVFGGREIVSRGRVPVDIFFRTRQRTTLKVKVNPDQPEIWVALG